MPLESNKEKARYSSLQEFMSFTRESDNAPSQSNLFSVHFSTPPILQPGAGNVNSKLFQTEVGDLSLLLDYYAKNVNLPSKQITTGQVVNVGSGYKFATGTSFSQISMTFQMPRSQLTRNFFEKWTTLMTSDANQYTEFYNNYCCPRLFVYKWERGGGDYAYTDPKLLRAIRDASIGGSQFLLAKKHKLTAVWELQNVFPYNIGSVQLDNGQNKLMDLNVQFYYECYRFYPEHRFDDDGIIERITFPAEEVYKKGDTTTPETPRNVEAANKFSSGVNLALDLVEQYRNS